MPLRARCAQSTRYRTIGLVGAGSRRTPLSRDCKATGGTTFVDVTDAIDHLKAIKKRGGTGLIKQCALMQDAVFAKVARSIQVRAKFARHRRDPLAAARGPGARHEQGIFLGNSAPVGQRAPFAPRICRGAR